MLNVAGQSGQVYTKTGKATSRTLGVSSLVLVSSQTGKHTALSAWAGIMQNTAFWQSSCIECWLPLVSRQQWCNHFHRPQWESVPIVRRWLSTVQRLRLSDALCNCFSSCWDKGFTIWRRWQHHIGLSASRQSKLSTSVRQDFPLVMEIAPGTPACSALSHRGNNLWRAKFRVTGFPKFLVQGPMKMFPATVITQWSITTVKPLPALHRVREYIFLTKYSSWSVWHFADFHHSHRPPWILLRVGFWTTASAKSFRVLLRPQDVLWL